MDQTMSQRSTKIGAYASTALLVFSWLLALGLAGMGIANRRSVSATADAAAQGRALDRAVTAAGTLALLRPQGPGGLQETLEEFVDDRILEAWVVGGNGIVVAASDPKWRGRSLSAKQLDRMRRCQGNHLVIHMEGGKYEVWLPVRRAGPGWRRWRRMWRMWRRHHRSLRMGGADRSDMAPPEQEMGPGWEGPDGPPMGGRIGRGRHGLQGPPPFDRPPGEGPPPVPPWSESGPPYLRFVVDVDMPAIGAAVRRARAVAVVSLIVALLLMVGSGLVFAAGRRNRALQEELARQAHLAELGELAAVLAHEIRNPLGVMKGNAQLASERLGDGAPEELGLIVEQSSRLERLVNALLDYARPAVPRRTKVDLAALAGRCAEMLAHKGMEAGVMIVTDLEPVEAWVDGDQIQQVLLNLLDNALDVSDQTVTLAVKRMGDRALLSVEDTGPGIAREVVGKLFRPFVTTKAKGTGLGLAIAKRIVEAHQGSIRATDVPGKGARFEVILPLSRSTGG